MPDFWSHNLGARESYRQNYDNQPGPFFLLGAQGPDIFYFIGKPTLFYDQYFDSFGDTLHEKKIREQIASAIEYAWINKGEISDYVRGYLVHYIFDSICHPHIYARTETLVEHKRLEMKLDHLIISEFFGTTHQKIVRSLTEMPLSRTEEILGKFWSVIARDVYKINLTSKKSRKGLGRSFKDIHTVVKMTAAGFFNRLPGIRFFSDKLHFDLTAFRRLKQVDPVDTDYASFRSLYEHALKVAPKMMKEYDEIMLCNYLEEKNILVSKFIEEYVSTDFAGVPIPAGESSNDSKRLPRY